MLEFNPQAKLARAVSAVLRSLFWDTPNDDEVTFVGGARSSVGVFMRITMERRTPKAIRVDHGPEFISKVLDQWAYRNGVTLDLSLPGKPNRQR